MSELIYQSIPVDILEKIAQPDVDRLHNGMKYEFARLSSFVSFPESSGGRLLKLAKAGFVFNPLHANDDTVTCFSCRLSKNNWTRFDDPMEIHKVLNPDCDFVKGISANIAILVPKDDICQKIKDILGESSSDDRTMEISRSEMDTLNRVTDSSQRGTMLINDSNIYASLILAADLGRETMVREEARLRTFRHWPRHLAIRPRDLARAGFYYLGSSDRVQCAFCRGILRDWDESDDSPVAEHWRYFPQCTLLRGLDDRNVPLIPDDTFIADFVAAHPQSSDETLPIDPLKNILKSGNVKVAPGKDPTTIEDLGIIGQTVAFPEQAILGTRVESFSSWPRENSPPSKQDLADAGFFFTGHRDVVKCFYCGGCLQSWRNDDVPWVEHARWFPTCDYLVRVKGQKFIDTHHKPDNGTAEVVHLDTTKGSLFNKCKVVVNDPDEVANSEPEVETKLEIPGDVVDCNQYDDPEIQSSATTRLRRENKELKEQRLCKICLVEEANVIILPCGHLVLCISCASNVTKCPICSKEVKGIVKTFI